MEYSNEIQKTLDKNGLVKTLCFTGHRTIPERDMEQLIKALDLLIEKAVEDGYRVFLSGGALGFDTVAAFRVLAAKEKFEGLRLMLVLPCRNQTEKWKSLKSIREYQILKDNADAVIYTGDFYDEGCMHRRNRFMVEKSSRVISYLTREKGGSAYTVNYAKRLGKESFNVADVMSGNII